MKMPLVHFIYYFLSFIAIWIGSGLIVRSVNKLAVHTKLPSFIVSFFILGIMTSTPEFAVGFTSILESKPQIFVGNLLGGTVILFLLLIPLLVLINGKHKNDPALKSKLPAILVVNAFPAIFLLDKQLRPLEGFIMIAAYFALFIMFMQAEHRSVKNQAQLLSKKHARAHLLKIVLGVVILFVSARFIVTETVYFAQQLGVPSFFLSLIAISFGTNLPELSLSIRSIFSKQEAIALGDYLGSASANTLLFGIFTVLNGGFTQTADEYQMTSIFIIFMLVTFYMIFVRSKVVTRPKAIFIMLLYAVFLLLEFTQKG